MSTSSTPPRRRTRAARATRAKHRAAPSPRRGLLVLGAFVGVATIGITAALAIDGPVDVDEILTADETTPPPITDVAPAPLSAEVRGEMIQKKLHDVPVPFPRNVEIHDIVAAAGPTDEAQVAEAVDATLRDWNLTPDGALIHNACPPHARACVDVDNRLAWLQEDGRVVRGPLPITTGMPGYESPRGEFTVQRKVRDEISYVFDNDPMPFSVYFTTSGVAFHGGSLIEDSHGCIHLDIGEAEHFFNVLHPNDIVVVM